MLAKKGGPGKAGFHPVSSERFITDDQSERRWTGEADGPPMLFSRSERGGSGDPLLWRAA